MPKARRLTICGPAEVFPKLDLMNLRKIFSMDTEQVLKYLAYSDLLKNSMRCDDCSDEMSLVKRSVTHDGFEWSCTACKKHKSVRNGSFFAGSKLPLDKCLALLHCWIEDFRNKNAIREAEVDKMCVVRWFLRCRKLPEYTHMLIRHKKKTGGGFSKMVTLQNGSQLNVNTNKCEGLWAHLKHKTKRIYGTSMRMTFSYMQEQLFRQNTRASGMTITDAFVKRIQKKYPV